MDPRVHDAKTPQRQPLSAILVVESDPTVRASLGSALRSDPAVGRTITETTSLTDAARALETARFDLVLLGVTGPTGDELRWFADESRRRPLPPAVALISAPALAVTAIGAGILECVSRHECTRARLVEAIARAMARHRVAAESLAVLRDREEQLRHAQRLEAVGRLAGGIAHDFRNLLTVVLGASERLVERLPWDDPLKRYADSIYDAALRAADLTQRLLAFSRQQPVQLTVLNLSDLIIGSKRLLQTLLGETIELRIRCDDDVTLIRADKTQIEQVLFNLAGNARDAMPNGGRLTIDIRSCSRQDAPASLSADVDACVRVSVTDTGIGMDAPTAARAFEPFFTTKEVGKGSGLGLSTVNQIVRECGGVATIDSEPGAGTSVSLFLPHVSAISVPASEPTTPTTAVGGTETILLVEDEDDVRALVEDILTSAGYRVLVAPRPTVAEQLVAEFGSTIDLLVTDVVMPDMTGIQLAGRIKDSCPRIQVLYMSGYPDRPDGDRSMVPEPLILKPFKRRALLQRVRELLDGAVFGASEQGAG